VGDEGKPNLAYGLEIEGSLDFRGEEKGQEAKHGQRKKASFS